MDKKEEISNNKLNLDKARFNCSSLSKNSIYRTLRLKKLIFLKNKSHIFWPSCSSEWIKHVFVNKDVNQKRDKNQDALYNFI